MSGVRNHLQLRVADLRLVWFDILYVQLSAILVLSYIPISHCKTKPAVKAL